MPESRRGTGGRKHKGKECAHLETGTRYLFTPKMGAKVLAITYCKKCGKELNREAVSVKKPS